MEASFSSNVRRLERQLKEIRTERDGFERNIRTYEQENSMLKEQVAQLHTKYTDSDSKAVQVLREIQEQHKQLTDLREEEHTTEVKEKNVKIKTLQETIRQLKVDAEKLKQHDQENNSVLSTSRMKVAALEETVKKLEKEIENKNGAIADTKSKLEKNMEKTSSQHLVRIRILEDQLKMSRLENEQKNSELAKAKIQLVSDQNKAQSESSKTSSELKLLQKQVLLLKTELKEKDDLYNKASSELSSKKSDIESVKSKNRVQLRLLEDKINRFKEEIHEKDNQIKLANRKVTSQQSISESISAKHQTELSAAQDEVKRLRFDLKEKNDELQQVSANLSASRSSKSSTVLKHKAEVHTLEDEVENLKAKLASKDGEICSLKNNLLSVEKKDEKTSSKYLNRLERLQEDLKALSKENDLKDIKLKKSKRDIERLESECRLLSSQHKIEVDSLDEQIASLRRENHEKEEKLCLVSSKLSSFENESESSILKQRIHSKALSNKLERLEKEIKQKDEELCKLTAQLDSQQMDVHVSSSYQRTRVHTLEEKVNKLIADNKNKEEQLCNVSSKLTRCELEGDTAASSYRVKVCALEDKLEILQATNQQKEERLILIEAQSSQKESQLQLLQEKLKRIEIENRRKEEDLNRLQSLEQEQASKSSESSSLIKSLQRGKRKLEVENEKLGRDTIEWERKVSTLESDVAEYKCSLLQKEATIEKALAVENTLKEDLAVKISAEKKLEDQIQSLKTSKLELKTELQHTNNLKNNLVKTVEDLSEKLKLEEKQRKILEDSSTTRSSKLLALEAEKNKAIEQQKAMISNLRNQFDDLNQELREVQKENRDLEEQSKRLRNDSHLSDSLKLELEKCKDKLNQMQEINTGLVQQQEITLKEHKDVCRKIEKLESETRAKASSETEQEKIIKALKESCMMLEKQAEDLEGFNNELIEKQNEVARERDEALTKCSTLKQELSSSKHQLKAELSSLDQCNTDQITELKIELRNEMNNLHEITEEHRNLERRYKNLELTTTALQRKLNKEKDAHESCRAAVDRLRSDTEVLQQSMRRLEQNLHSEINRCDALEREKTQLLNRVDTEKLEHSHELVRLNCQGAQQTKLIDFLQSRVEELEPSEKKKKKQKKTTLYQAPLQYRELCDLLEEEKASNVRLQEQVNSLRSELQATNSKVKRMKHGMDTPLSPGSIAAITAIVKSPVCSSVEGATSPKSGKLRSKPRMHHNIPHRLSSWVCHRAMRCSVCLATIYFGHSALKCSECAVVCHTKCRKSITNTCGLPGGLFQQFKDGTKSSNLSPITCVFKGNNADQLHGKLKVLCGDDTWILRSVRISSGQIRIATLSCKSPTKNSVKDDVIDLNQAASIQTDLGQSELPNTSKMDLSYAFKVQTGSTSSCWPARSIYFLAAGYAEKHMWVEKLEEIVAKHNQSKNISANAKILGNEILTLLSDEKLEINCSLPISDKTILLGCDEGLFLLSPSTSSVSSRANMRKINNVTSVFQIESIGKSQVLAIEGQKHRLVSFDVSSVGSGKVSLQSIEELDGCHLFSIGQAEGLYYLCVASAACVTLLKYNEKMKKFCKKKEIATSEPCTCMVFTACSVIIGTSTFYEIDLTEFKIDEFIDDNDAIASPYDDRSVFPVSVLKIKQRAGKQEFLLCFHEFGIFVDGFGYQTRSGRLMWPRMPLSFEYREPFLIIVQFNSVAIILLDVNETPTAECASLDQAFLSFPSARYLGPAITEGAIYLSSNVSGRMSVFCCKGNMKESAKTIMPTAPAMANKRRLVALSASTDSLAPPSSKRSAEFSDASSVYSIKTFRDAFGSTQSINSDTSRWMSGVDDGRLSSVTTTIESGSFDSLSEESMSCSQESTKLQWRPTKPLRRRGNKENDYDQVPSTQV